MNAHEQDQDAALLLTAYADGALNAADQEKVSQAIQRNPALQKELDDIIRLQHSLREILPQHMSQAQLTQLTPERFDFILQQATPTLAPEKTPKPLRFPVVWGSLAAGIAAGLIAGVAMYYPVSSDRAGFPEQVFTQTLAGNTAALSAEKKQVTASEETRVENKILADAVGVAKSDSVSKVSSAVDQPLAKNDFSAVGDQSSHELLARSQTPAPAPGVAAFAATAATELEHSAQAFSVASAAASASAPNAYASEGAEEKVAAQFTTHEVTLADILTPIQLAQRQIAPAMQKSRTENAAAFSTARDNTRNIAPAAAQSESAVNKSKSTANGTVTSFVAAYQQRTSSINKSIIDAQHFINAMASAWGPMPEMQNALIINAAPIPAEYAAVLAPCTHVIALAIASVPQSVVVQWSSPKVQNLHLLGQTTQVGAINNELTMPAVADLAKITQTKTANAVLLYAVQWMSAPEQNNIHVHIADDVQAVTFAQETQPQVNLALSAWLTARLLRGENIPIARASIEQLLSTIDKPHAQILHELLQQPAP
jgi:anti-sigma factor RsiW